jgi:preprotein translocase subunit Sec63
VSLQHAANVIIHAPALTRIIAATFSVIKCKQTDTWSIMKFIMVLAVLMGLTHGVHAMLNPFAMFRKKDTRTPAEVLGIPADASCEEINQARRVKSRQHHTDKKGKTSEVKSCYCSNKRFYIPVCLC